MNLRLLSLNEVKQNITMLQAIDAMENAFIQLAKKQVKLPLRTALPIETEKAIMLTMPAFLTQDQALGLKIISVFPNNLSKNKPSITGCIMLLDATTGEPKALMDAGYLTALRTGAISGLATKYFSRENSDHLAIIGSGPQALTQFEAVTAVRPIRQVSIWSRNSENAQSFAKKIDHKYNVQCHKTVTLAVQDADIICTATSSSEPLIHLTDIQPHVHINAVGSHAPSMREIGNEVLGHGLVIVDQLEAALAEAGEIIAAIETKQLKKESIVEIGAWLLNKSLFAQDRITIFKSVGLAIQDMSVAEIVYHNALKKNQGFQFKLD